MYTLTRKGSVTYVQALALEGFDFLTHAFCTRHCGVSQGAYAGLNMSPVGGDDPSNIRENWHLVSQAFAIEEEHFILLRQVHEDGVMVLNQLSKEGSFHEPPAFDAVITDQPNQALCIRTADCVPIFIVDPERRIIANIHAGWKGTALNITAKVIGTMEIHFGSRAEHLIAVIGPAIGSCCYEVDDPVIKAMGPWGENRAVCRPASRAGRRMLDLPLINRNQMTRSGIPAENISLLDLCTSCREDLFFSHRRDGGITGRQVHFIMLQDRSKRKAKKT
jgi:polyphenol oxidase